MTYNWTQKGRGIPSYQYQTSCDGKDGTYGNASTSLVINEVQPEDAGEYHLSYIHKDIGPQNPLLICTLIVNSKFTYFIMKNKPKIKVTFKYVSVSYNPRVIIKFFLEDTEYIHNQKFVIS